MSRARHLLVLSALLFWLGLVLWGTLSEGSFIQNSGGILREIRDQWKVYQWKIYQMPLPPAILDNYRLLKDITINFLLFVPLGFFVGLLARKYLKRNLVILGLGWALSYSISWGIEFLQRSVALRYSSSRDITWNTLGGIFGIALALYFLGLIRRFPKPEKEVG